MNILLVSLDQAKLYPPRIQKYIKSRYVNCYLSKWRKSEIEEALNKYGLNPKNTIIHARVANPEVNETFKNLESRGFRVINPSISLKLTSNKYLTYQAAKRHKIPTPETFKVSKNDTQKILKILQKFKTAVLKPVYSRGLGKYCKKIEHGATSGEVESAVSDIPGGQINVQQYIDYIKLIRVIVIGGKALRQATTYDEPTQSWKASVCMNPNLKKYSFKNLKLFKLAEKIARDFKLEITFIDFFDTGSGEIILNEINTACGFIIHEDVTKVKIHEHIGDYLIKQAEMI